MKIITQNKKAFHDYEVLEKLEAGIKLTGDEVKSLRAGNANLVGAFATIHDGELFMINCYIAPYSHAYQKDEDKARRSRKLLVHRNQLNRLIGEIARKGITIVPLKLYFNEKGIIKVELGLCKHKKAHVRKEEIRERDIQRQTRRELRGKYDY
ncbi:MAG: SsrA-binding protein SmpB [Candidatus Babeliaceae bacterium]